ncbi:tetratricopeptide repeat protein [Gottfriedia acidiceleris]|uniref:tetratricopeptide repeat protein n=1 Tax=Gottfriedia acidiceleris TaxID=371036 RepID=UPI003D2490F8
MTDYTKAIELNSKDYILYYNRGLAYYQKQMYDRAIADYNKAIDLNPKDYLSYNNRGLTFYDQKMYDQAISVKQGDKIKT